MEGIKVADFTEIIAGPLAGRLLAEMGADVHQDRTALGRTMAAYPAFHPHRKPHLYGLQSRQTQPAPGPYQVPRRRKFYRALIPRIDVVLVNYRPDVAAKLGVDYETLSAINPRLVYCELTAYGRQGPGRPSPRLRYDYSGNDRNDCLGNQNCGQRSILGLVQSAD